LPVATQEEALVQETDVRCTGPPSAVVSGPDGDHPLPEYAYRVSVLVAMQKLAVGHDTPVIAVALSRRGADHELPA
jgi:hypothetical protein